VIAHIYVKSVEAIFHSEQFIQSKNTLQELYLELFRYHIRGISSDQGRAYLIQKIKTEQTQN
jgi:hypothetical protein